LKVNGFPQLTGGVLHSEQVLPTVARSMKTVEKFVAQYGFKRTFFD
jgi:hypothetical protein